LLAPSHKENSSWIVLKQFYSTKWKLKSKDKKVYRKKKDQESVKASLEVIVKRSNSEKIVCKLSRNKKVNRMLVKKRQKDMIKGNIRLLCKFILQLRKSLVRKRG